MRLMITGAAGFIGFHSAQRFLEKGFEIIGVDNLNDYYDVNLKKARLALLEANPRFKFRKVDIADREAFSQCFSQARPELVLHLAAQAGVRHSLERPYDYIEANITATLNVLESCRAHPVQHLVYASSSSVYGIEEQFPFSADQPANHPTSLYGATKKSCEMMAHAYSHLFKIRTTGLRFFTVYGPWGRPDMALFKFTQQILADKEIELYNHGDHSRDFTYVDDIVNGIEAVLTKTPRRAPEWKSSAPQSSISSGPYRLYNIGGGNPASLAQFVLEIEKNLGCTAKKKYLPLQPGDVPATFADLSGLREDFGYEIKTDLVTGVRNFVNWYREYYRA